MNGVKINCTAKKVRWLYFSRTGMFKQPGFRVSMNLKNYMEVCMCISLCTFCPLGKESNISLDSQSSMIQNSQGPMF